MRWLAVTLALLATLAVPTSLLAQRKDCRETLTPKDLPEPREVIDSAGAIAEPKRFNRLSDSMLFSLIFPDGDSLPRVRLLVGADPQAALVLLRSVWPQKPSGIWAVRVRVVGGASPALTVERSIYCPPNPLPGPNPSAIPVSVRIQARPGDHPPPSGRIEFDLAVLVDANGGPAGVRVLQSSGMSQFDEHLTREWQQRRFEPALLDGTPLQALYRTDGHSPRL
jgi:hypothetical protein